MVVQDNVLSIDLVIEFSRIISVNRGAGGVRAALPPAHPHLPLLVEKILPVVVRVIPVAVRTAGVPVIIVECTTGRKLLKGGKRPVAMYQIMDIGYP